MSTAATHQSPPRPAIVMLLWASMLATPSSGFVSSQMVRPGIDSPMIGSLVARDIPTTVVVVAPHLRNQGYRRLGHGALLSGVRDSSLETGFRDRLMEVISTLRGGKSPVQTSGSEAGGATAAGAAAAALGAVSPMGGVALFVQGLLLSMVMSLGGFRVREHFVVYGYGFSVALQAAAAAWLFRESLHVLSALHAVGLIAYGLRLVIFCRWRDSLECFQERRRRQVSQSSGGRPYKFWAICSMLYALLALPTVYVQRRLPASEGWAGVSQAGLATMAAGLLVEGVADWQKSRFKVKEKDNFISSGLFRFSRHANYFGEVVFWGGVWLAATPSFTKWYHWVFASLGTSQIFFIIARATRGLGKRQAEKYGSSKEWKAYVESTPALVPFTRQWGKRDGQ